MNANGQRKQADREFFALKKALGLRPQSLQGDLCLNVPQTRLMAEAKHRHKVLEVGCAGGELTLALNLNGCDADGIDPSPAAIAHCEKHCEGQFASHYEQADSVGEYYKSDYDAVIICGALDVEEDPEPLLEQAFSKVAEGGYLHVAVGKQRFNRDHVAHLVHVVGDGYPFHVEPDEHYFYLTVHKDPVATRYLFLTPDPGQAEQANECVWDLRAKSGIWTWARLFRGKAQYMEHLENLEDYDVVHVQLSGDMLDYPRRLKALMDPEQTLVINPDYSMELWGGYMRYPDLFWEQLNYADRLFSVEPRTAAMVEHFLERPCPVIPHPVNIDLIKRRRVPRELRQDAMVIAHQDVRSHLGYYHYEHTGMKIHYSGPNPGREHGSVSLFDMLFDYIHGPVSGGEMLDSIARRKICTDAYSWNVSGRISTELAALGVPSIGYPTSVAQKFCFPQTTFEEMDIPAIRECVTRLCEDGMFYEEVSDYAQDAVGRYAGFDVSKQRFLAMLEEENASRCDDPRLGIPEGTTAHGQEAGRGVGHPAPEVGNHAESRESRKSLDLQGPSDDSADIEGAIPKSRHAYDQALAAV